MSPLASYRRLFTLAGPLYVAVAFVGRLPLAMAQMGTLLLVAGTTGSYGTGGAAAGALAVANAVGAPVAGSLADRVGQRPVVLVQSLLGGLGLLALVALAQARVDPTRRRHGCRGRRRDAADRAARTQLARAPDHPRGGAPSAAPDGGRVLLRGSGRRGLVRARPGPARPDRRRGQPPARTRRGSDHPARLRVRVRPAPHGAAGARPPCRGGDGCPARHRDLRRAAGRPAAHRRRLRVRPDRHHGARDGCRSGRNCRPGARLARRRLGGGRVGGRVVASLGSAMPQGFSSPQWGWLCSRSPCSSPTRSPACSRWCSCSGSSSRPT